jgi:hypothetical protein
VTDIEIANLTLTRCGCNPIGSFDDVGSNEARVIKQHYTIRRDALLERAEWTFATSRIALAKEAVTPPFEYRFSYAIPSDVLSVRRLFQPQTPGTTVKPVPILDYVREGQSILCNVDGAIGARVIKRVSEAKFSPLFCLALSDFLGIEVAGPLTENRSLVADFTAAFLNSFRDATFSDAQQGKGLVIRPTALRGRRQSM